MDLWHGFEIRKETVDGRDALIVLPEEGKANGKWALKTEYFDAFPNVEIELVKLGYHLAYIKNKSRWNRTEDTDAKAKLAEYMRMKYGVLEKCVIVGMSCGGMQGIYFAAKYPQYVSCMYLDAPVVNLLSNPGGLGTLKEKANNMEEFTRDIGMNITQLLSYRNHPLDCIPTLLKQDIPIILIGADEDQEVVFEENGKLLQDAYEENGKIIKTIIKKGCGHHPHSLEDNTPIIEFIETYYK